MHINYKVFFKIIGFLTMLCGYGMLPCAAVGLHFEEWSSAGSLFISSLCLIVAGSVIHAITRLNEVHLRYHEGWLIACVSWVYCSLLGSIPIYFCGMDYTYVGSFFEAVAGFTTTGCSVFDINFMPKSILMWKAVSSWFGGMGILVLVVSVFPALGISGQSIASAETTGPTLEKLGEKYSDTGRFLYKVYFAVTVTEFLLLLIGPLDWYDAIITTLSSVSTGGIVITSENEALFTSTYVRFVVIIFTILSSLNYCIYFLVRKRRFKEALTYIETRVFFMIIAVSTLLIALCLKITGTYSSMWQAIKDSLSQVVSFIATSGYYVCDYTEWPTFTVIILFSLLLIGGCSMSTSGSMKIMRFTVFIKLIQRGLFKQVHPRGVKAIKVDGQVIPADKVSAISTHIMLYFASFFLACIVLSFNNFDMETTITTAIGFFSNTGMAMGEAGCTGYFGMFNGFSQFFLAFIMIMGRLEMYSILLLFSKSFWMSDSANTI